MRLRLRPRSLPLLWTAPLISQVPPLSAHAKTLYPWASTPQGRAGPPFACAPDPRRRQRVAQGKLTRTQQALQDPRASRTTRPASARARACAQELGQPVQCMRTLLGMSSCSSSLLTTAIARFFVSMMATPQNCAQQHHGTAGALAS